MSPFRDVVKWLESEEGQAWSKARHKASGNQTDLMSLKAMDEYEQKQTLWKSAMTVPTDWPWGIV